MKYHYKKADPKEREISDLSTGNHVITSERGLYNENLTIEELSLLRDMIWDCIEWQRTAPYPEDFTSFIHTWLFENKKRPKIHQDIINDIENGVEFEKR